MRSKCWRARISVGAISAAWPPASTALAMASSATTVLPEPTSPCSRRSMRLSDGEVGADLGERPRLRAGEREGQGGARSSSRAGRRRRCCAPAAAASGCARGRARAARRGARHRRGAAAPGSRRRPRARRRRRQPGDEAGAAPRRRRGSGSASRKAWSCHSGSAGTRCERRADELADEPRREPLGQPIDRLDRRQLADAALVEDAVRVDHLAVAVPDLDLAARRSAPRRPAGALSMRSGWALKKTSGCRRCRPRRGRGNGALPRRGGPGRCAVTLTFERHRLADRRLGDRAFAARARCRHAAGGTGGRRPAPAVRARRAAGRAARAIFGPTPGSAVAGANSGSRRAGRMETWSVMTHCKGRARPLSSSRGRPPRSRRSERAGGLPAHRAPVRSRHLMIRRHAAADADRTSSATRSMPGGRPSPRRRWPAGVHEAGGEFAPVEAPNTRDGTGASLRYMRRRQPRRIEPE